MRNKIKVLEDFSEENVTPVSAQFHLPKNWWNSCTTFGAEEKKSKLDLIHLHSERITNPNLTLRTDWNINEGDYEIELPPGHVHSMTVFEERVKKERLYLGIGILAVVLVVTLFSFLASMIG